MPRLASPCADILYYLYTSVKTETRTERLRELLILYFSVFQTTLCGFGKKSPVNFDVIVVHIYKMLVTLLLIRLRIITGRSHMTQLQ